MSKKTFIYGTLAIIVVLLLIAGGAFLRDKEPSTPPANGMALMAPIVQETPLSHPKFQSFSLNITSELRYHNYYNSLAHGAKASPISMDIVITQGHKVITYQNTGSIKIKLQNISTTEIIMIELKVTPSNANVSTISTPIILTVPNLNERDVNIHIPFDFSYPKEGLAFPLTHLEREAMSSIVALEHGGGPAEAKRAVAKVILNRRRHGYQSIYHVIFAKNAFTTARLIDPETGLTPFRNTETYPYKSCKDAVDHVSLYGLEGFPHSVVYFRSEYFFDWAVDYKKIGALYFSHNPKYM